MSDTIIKVANLTKKYIIGHQRQERYTTLRDVIARQFSQFWPPSRPAAQPPSSPAAQQSL